MVVLCVLAAACMALLFNVASASAALSELEASHMPEIVQWVYRNGAVENPDPCGTVCGEMWGLEHKETLIKTSPQVWDELGALEDSTGLWGTLSELSGLLKQPQVESTGKFAIGWRIGFTNSKWMEVGPSFESVPAMATCSAAGVGLMPPGHEFGPTEHEKVSTPGEWTFVLTESPCATGSEYQWESNTIEEKSCTPVGAKAVLGGEWTEVQWWWNENLCGLNEKGEKVFAKMIAHGWYAPFHFGIPEEWSGQSRAHNAFTAPSGDPGTVIVQAATELMLEENGAFNTWVNEALGRAVNTLPESFGPGSAASPNRLTCYQGKPVNCATGNETETETDLSVGGRGPGLRLTRTYNSQLAAKQTSPGPFGYGWTGSYSAHLEVSPTGEEATVYQDDGSVVRFFGKEGHFPETLPLVQATLVTEGSNYIYTLPNQTKLEFNSEGKLVKETDRNGNAVTLAYNSGTKRLETVTDAAGRKLTYAYNGEGQVETVKDPMGHTVKYAYESGNSATVTLPGETEPRWKFKYNTGHELTEMTDGRKNTVTTTYEAGRVVSQKDALGRERKWKYTGTEAAPETTITQPNGSETVEKFNQFRLPISVTRASGTGIAATTEYEYDGSYNLIAVTDPNKHTTKSGYNAAGDKTSETDPNSNETKWTYNTTHDVETMTTPKGETTTIKRDTHGNPEVIERPAPGAKTQITKYKHAANGDLESMENPLKNVWKYEYNTHGDRTTEIDPLTNKRTWEYNEDSQETATVSPKGNVTGGKPAKFTTKTERDEQGRPLKIEDPLKHTTKYKYDGNGNIETLIDGNSRTKKYTYDADNERTKTEEPNKTVIETEFDSMGQVKSQTDGNKNTTKYERNLLEEVTEVTDPLARITKKTYDAAGNLKTLEDPAKRTTTFTHDPGNRLTEVSYSSGKPATIKYEYDKDSNRTKMEDGTGITKNTFDQLDRPTESRKRSQRNQQIRIRPR